MAQRGAFEFDIMPAKIGVMKDMEELRDHINEYSRQHGMQKCAVLGQIHFEAGGRMRYRGRLYTGKALDTIAAAMLEASRLQDKIDAGKEP